jgi:hypothetical protein
LICSRRRQKKKADGEEEEMSRQNWFCFSVLFDRRRERKKKKKKPCRVFVWSKFVFIGRNSTSFCCLWISREEDQHPGGTDESERRFLFFWIVTMRYALCYQFRHRNGWNLSKLLKVVVGGRQAGRQERAAKSFVSPSAWRLCMLQLCVQGWSRL